MIASIQQLALTSVSAALFVTLLSGCATKPTISERNFGAAVKQMIQAQTYDLKAAQEPEPEPVRVLDGEHAAQIIEVYQKDVAKPEEVRNEIQINVGTGSTGGR